jgi:hypothetical protein
MLANTPPRHFFTFISNLLRMTQSLRTPENSGIG